MAQQFIPGLNREAPNYSLVLSKVEKVLADNSVFEPPVQPKELAETYGAQVYFATFPDDLKNVSGFYDLTESAIFVNESDPPNRQTFTIAHELGHHLLHREYLMQNPSAYNVLWRKPILEEKQPLEQEANAFAANLLVPRDFLFHYAKIASGAELARLFVVSEEVIRWRLRSERLTEAA